MAAKFWLLQTPPDQPLAEEGVGAKWETIRCPSNEGHMRGGKRLTRLSIVVPPAGVRDFTWSWVSEIFVSKRVLDVFRNYQVTGYELEQVNAAYPLKVKASPPEMFELIVTGWGGLPSAKAVLKLVEACPDCGHKVYAIADPTRIIDPRSWDGSDLFIVWPLPRFIFVSDRLAHIIRKENLSGVKLVPAEAIPMRKGVTLTPAPLSWRMGEERAGELTQRFRIP